VNSDRCTQRRVKECSNVIVRTGAPHFGGPTRVPKHFGGQSCLLVCITVYKNWRLNCTTKIELNTVIWPFSLILWVYGPQICPSVSPSPTFVNPAVTIHNLEAYFWTTLSSLINSRRGCFYVVNTRCAFLQDALGCDVIGWSVVVAECDHIMSTAVCASVARFRQAAAAYWSQAGPTSLRTLARRRKWCASYVSFLVAVGGAYVVWLINVSLVRGFRI